MPPPDYYTMMRELHAIGTNLNQIAQKAHVLNAIDVKRYDENAAALNNSDGSGVDLVDQWVLRGLLILTKTKVQPFNAKTQVMQLVMNIQVKTFHTTNILAY
jgi:hypothetical protein